MLRISLLREKIWKGTMAWGIFGISEGQDPNVEVSPMGSLEYDAISYLGGCKEIWGGGCEVSRVWGKDANSSSKIGWEDWTRILGGEATPIGDPIDDGEDSDSTSIGVGLGSSNIVDIWWGRGMLSTSLYKLKRILILSSIEITILYEGV